MVGEHCADGMYCVVAIEAFGLQSFQDLTDGKLVTQRHLILHHDVDRRMQALVRQRRPRTAMIFEDRLHPVALVRSEPVISVRGT